MVGPEQAFRFKPNHPDTTVPLVGKQVPVKLNLYILILLDPYGKNHIEDKQEPLKNRSDFVVILMAENVL